VWVDSGEDHYLNLVENSAGVQPTLRVHRERVLRLRRLLLSHRDEADDPTQKIVLGGLDSKEGKMERRYEQLADGVILAGVLVVVGFVIYIIAVGF
jgi:hypothetical protein